MTCQAIIDAARGIIQQTDPANSTVLDSLMLVWISECCLQLFSLLNTLPKANISNVVAASTIALPTSLIKLDYASILTPEGKHRPLTTTDFCNFVRLTPNWEDQAANIPSQLVRLDDLNWMMFPSPNADYLGKALTLYGTVNPVTALTASDSPAISIVMHPCFEHFVAWKSFLRLNDPTRAGQEYSAFDALKKQNMGTATTTTGSLKHLVMPPDF